jgi:hypothetical protein
MRLPGAPPGSGSLDRAPTRFRRGAQCAIFFRHGPVAAGFTNVHNIIDGMEGDQVKDPDSLFMGQRLKNGWKNSGLPWTYDLTPERMLLHKATELRR